MQLATATIFAALVCVATVIFVISIPATFGYFNLGETVIYIAALLFGPYVGAISGGIGASAADIMLAPQFALGTLVIKGLEGAIIGFLKIKLARSAANQILSAIAATVIGGLEMVAGYFLYEQIVLGYSMAAALAEVPFNIVQMLIGIIVAVPIAGIVSIVFPQLKS
ncbi:MAG: ECF transporter S component [Candidatus Bathyarchaeota archaeon]|nr:ECF transporter S component [Candidatus Bathyarchaeota archaeon]